METADTAPDNPRHLTAARVGDVTCWWAVRAAAAVLLLSSCADPAKPAKWSADACDASAEFEKCADERSPQRWRCDPLTNTWVTIGYCPTGFQCVPAELPTGATAGVGTTCADSSVEDASAQDVKDGGANDSGANDTKANDGAAKDSETKDSETKDGETKDADTDSGPAADVSKDSVDAAGGLCGNGVCDKEESPTSCPVDCAKAVCGNGQCQTGEAENCPYDCSAGAAAGVSCMLAKCPGEGQQCKVSASCPLALAAIWSCAKGCSGCLSKCLSIYGKDPKVFAVASCSAAACL